MRQSYFFFAFVATLGLLGSLLTEHTMDKRAEVLSVYGDLQQTVKELGLSDLCLSTEARYTRHPAISDRVVVEMDHPEAIDHFPSTIFWTPVPVQKDI